jgi:hypothetical protein
VRVVPAAAGARLPLDGAADGDDLVAGASLALSSAPREVIEARMREVTGKRKKALPRAERGLDLQEPAGRLLRAGSGDVG